MEKLMKKILLLLTIALMLSACGKKVSPAENESGKTYLQKIKEYETRPKDQDHTTDNKDFEQFLDKVFVEGMEADFLTMHFNVIDYRKYGIEKPPVDLGQVKYGFDQENFDYMEDQLKELQSFDYDSLSYRQQYDYEALEYSLYETLADYAYYRYSFVFSTASCVPENLISNFTDYTFYDKESVDDYITCLKDVDRYMDDLLKYTEDQSKDKLYLLDEWIDYTQDVCDGVLNRTEDNELITSFEKRIQELDFLSETEKKDYISENRQIVLDEVLPAYSRVADGIEKYRGKVKIDNYALYKLDKDYAELVYMLQASNNKDLEEVFQELKDNFSYLEAQYVSCFYDESSMNSYQAAMDGEGNMSLAGKDCLEYLRKNLVAYYPDLGDVEYTVEALDPDTAPDTVVAYYWPSPIDNSNQNIIRTNPNNMGDGYGTYSTLAHEGFPGHLYQHVFYHKTNPHNFRSVIAFGGYTEGWAVNAQYYAFQFADIGDENAAAAVYFEDAYYFILYSIIDIGTNYFGWTAKDVAKFCKEETMLFSNMDQASAEDIRRFMIEMPGVYCSYGVGSSNFMTMCENTKAALGDRFDYIPYHAALMKNGPLPFNILQTAVDEYIAAQ
jgi:uncharacterized protein (DUF885 family)